MENESTGQRDTRCAAAAGEELPPMVQARFRAGLTQEQLALEVRCTRGHLCCLELGKARPSTVIAMRIARVLRDDVDHLFPAGVCRRHRLPFSGQPTGVKPFWTSPRTQRWIPPLHRPPHDRDTRQHERTPAK